MMVREYGKRAVWEHCKEAGIDGAIKKISSVFGDIKDICVITKEKISYIEEMPRKSVRIAVATKPEKQLSEYIKNTKGKK